MFCQCTNEGYLFFDDMTNDHDRVLIYDGAVALQALTYFGVLRVCTYGFLYAVCPETVYNVTKFAKTHPGGEEALNTVAGTDATDAFEDVGHSDAANNLMQSYLIGTVKRNERRRQSEPEAKPANKKEKLSPSEFAFRAIVLALVYSVIRLTAHLWFPMLKSLFTVRSIAEASFGWGFIAATVLCLGVIGFVNRSAAPRVDIHHEPTQPPPQLEAKRPGKP
ncbi:hypothetical protein MW887_000897 [Aspergillus wentii]|nr:hypothetical protein MW887_000897 [Aspergillus wentii]